MDNWSEIRLHWPAESLEKWRGYEDEIVWLFYDSRPERGIVPGRLFRYSQKAIATDSSLDELEFFFGANGERTFPSHWQVMVTGSRPPDPPDMTDLVCNDGGPHAWITKAIKVQERKETGRWLIVCSKCSFICDPGRPVQ